MEATQTTFDQVREYYGSVLRNNGDLKTTACCTTEALPAHVRAVLSEIDAEILDRFYGCGSPIPPALDGCTVLDLGCGSGRDVYVASRLVGPDGFVIGIDMTEEQLAVARRHREAQAQRFGYDRSNVDLRFGYIEDLSAAGVEDDSVDVVISNCVVNLSPDKRAVLSEIFRVLKTGGEFFFSDIFADRRIPDAVASDPLLYGECLGGAMYVEDFRRMLRDLGCLDYRVATEAPITVNDPELQERLGNIRFSSKTIRAFKLPGLLEDLCEDYGQVAYYGGTIQEAAHRFVFDNHHVFETGRPVLICGNTAAMLEATRFGRHFHIAGDRSVHYGLFDCSPSRAGDEAESASCC